MRIGIDARLWSESGVGRYIRNLVEQLQIQDKENDYVLFALSKDLAKFKIQNSKFKVIKADVKWHTIEEQFQFPQILHKEELDFIHFPYFSVPIFYKRPFVVTIHDLILDHFSTGEASTLFLPIYQAKLIGYRLIISRTVHQALKVITVSDTTKKEIISHFHIPEDNVVVTYEGVDEALNSKIKIPESKAQLIAQDFFLYVGNAYPHKNLERLVTAFANSKFSIPNLKLILIGKEDYFYKRLKIKIKKLGFDRKVVFVGQVSDKELAVYYRSALALIMPSLMEGFSLPTVEAMANNCLVLASDIPSLREVCGDAAIYFNPYDINDLTHKMKTVHSNDTYHYSDNIEKGLERTKMFSWQKMAKETLAVYNSVYKKLASISKV